MDPSLFGERRTGELVSVSGLPGVSKAFVPGPFPPKWEWPEGLWPLLVDARAALARLEGTGRHLPSPELLLRPLQNREAQRSSSLEGTYTKPEEQLLFQIEPRLPKSREDPANAQREVFNYAQALRLRADTQDQLPLSLRLIRRLHSVLLHGVRGSASQPGEFRRAPVQVGRPARFVPPPPNYINELLDGFEKYLHKKHRYDPLVEAFLAHYQFEAIHPFLDGNGRVGRLLLTVTITEWCQLSNQWLYMSAFFDNHKDEYIDRLFRISTEGDWEGWVEFCLKGVIVQAEDTQKRCDRLLLLNRDFHERIRQTGGSYRLNAIIDELFQGPVVQIPYLARRYEVTYPTAKADVDRLMSVEILRELPGLGQKTFYAPDIVEVTYAETD